MCIAKVKYDIIRFEELGRVVSGFCQDQLMQTLIFVGFLFVLKIGVSYRLNFAIKSKGGKSA